MITAILAITGFQGYWLKNNYDREKQNLDIKTNSSFRETILQLQSSKLKLDRMIIFDTVKNDHPPSGPVRIRRSFGRSADKKEGVITLVNLLQQKAMDSVRHKEKGVVVLSKSQTMSFDTTVRDIQTRIRPGEFPHPEDSIMLDPNAIRRINVNRDGSVGENVITIEYDKKKTKETYRDSVRLPRRGMFIDQKNMENEGPPANLVFKVLLDSVSTRDSITTKEVSTAYTARLKEDHVNIPFDVTRQDSVHPELPNFVTIGFARPVTFELSLGNTFGYMLGKLKLPILFSLLLIGITIVSFVLLYRNMIKQQRLAELKNEFISNITHELKTPIATVGVAIEALKNFNALHDPERTREYLDISQSELQRLNLLVDKVLKLSIFEKKEIELKKEVFDLRRLVEEVVNTMKLQFEKYKAKVSLHADGDMFLIEADKLHFTSVIYNLLDNALKYGGENPVIDVQLKTHDQHVELKVRDNGIGIPAEYKNKVFDKFFRVPTGDRHNIKGYGLGLSYVSEVVKRHHGFITVESESNKGSVFTVHIPVKEASLMQFDEHRSIKKEI